MKQTAHYSEIIYPVQVGASATIGGVHHPELGTNKPVVYTSEVVSYDAETGDFETLNTKYVKLTPAPFQRDSKGEVVILHHHSLDPLES